MRDAPLHPEDRGSPPLDPTSEPGLDRSPALDRFAEETLAAYVRLARKWMQRLGIDSLLRVPRGAVAAAWVMLGEEIRDGRIASDLTRADLERVLGLRLLKVLFRERRRQRTRRRGWGRVVSIGDNLPDLADPHDDPAEQSHEAREWVAWLLEWLGGHDPSLRAVLERKLEGLTSAEIAAKLGVSVSTIERKMREIRSIAGRHIEDLG